MKTIRIIFSLFIFAFLLSACEQEVGPLYEAPSANTLSFASDKYQSKWTPSDSDDALSTTSIQVELRRGSSEGALNVPLTFVAPTAFTIGAESAHFDAGETRSLITINFPAVKEWSKGSTYNMSIAIDSTSLAITGIAKINISLAFDYVWVAAGRVSLLDNTFTEETYPVDLQKAEGTNMYRLVDPFDTGTGQYLSFKLDEQWNALQDEMPNGLYDLVANGYQFYWHSNYVGPYCNFFNTANVYTLQFLILNVATDVLYTGGEIIFTWEDGYPGELPEPKLSDFNELAYEEIEGAVSDFASEAYFNSAWTQSLAKAVDLDPENPASQYKNLYYLADLYADGYGLAFYYDGETVTIPEDQPTGTSFKQPLYVSQSKNIESSVLTTAKEVSIYTFGLDFHYADGTSVGEFTETYYYSKEPVVYSISDFYGNYKLTGPSQFGPSEPDADMDVTIAPGASENTFIITGIDLAAEVKATFTPSTSTLSIAPQQLANYGPYDITMYTTTPAGEYNLPVIMDFNFNILGNLIMPKTSAADGYLLRSEAIGGWVDGYYNLVFTPQAARAPKNPAFTKPSVKSLQSVTTQKAGKATKEGNFSVQGKSGLKKVRTSLPAPLL
jgi:hypothetical protein